MRRSTVVCAAPWGSGTERTAQLILNYDFVFLAILLARPETGGTFPDCPCPVHPWRKKTCWLGLLPWTLRRTPR